MKKSISLLLVLSMVFAMSISGCSSNSTKSTGSSAATSVDTTSGTDAGAKKTSKTTMTVSSYSDPQTLNPYSINNRNAKRIYLQVYEHLLDRGEKSGEFVPMLAESWKVADDGLSVTFNLRHGVKFTNGEELKASDVVFSFNEMAKYGTVTSGIEFIKFKEVKAIDDYTVVVPLASKSSTVLWDLANDNLIIVNQKVWKEMGDSVATKAVGTGPFKINDGDYMLNDHIIFTRNDQYWGEKPVLEKVTMRFIPESTQAAIELEAGGIDLAEDVAPVDYDRIKKSSTMKLEEFPASNVDMIHFNNNAKPFTDVRVRQALAYAINRDDILKGTYMNWGQVAYSVIAPNIFGYTNEFEKDNWPYKTDYAKAKELLKEAGYPNGFTFDLDVDQDSNRQSVSEIIKNQLTKIGVTANIKNMEQSALNDMIAKNTAQSWLFGISASTMEPDQAMYIRYHSSGAHDGGSDHTRFKNADFDNLLDKARQTQDDSEKIKLYKQAQEIWVQQAPSVPYYVRLQMTASVNALKGLKGYGESYLFKDCYFE